MLVIVDKFPMLIGGAQPIDLLELSVKEVISMSINERLYKLRKEKNISQEELANEIGVSRQTISKWETGESTPDFDKIIPLCEFYGITSDELLSGKKDIIVTKEENVKSKFASNIAIAVGLYIFSIVLIIFFAAFLEQEIIGVCLFFITIAIATGLLIYNGIVNKPIKKELTTKQEKQKTVVKQVCDIVDLICLIAYFLVSFLTGAWHLTWIIFILMGLLDSIVKLIFNIKEDNEEENEENE